MLVLVHTSSCNNNLVLETIIGEWKWWCTRLQQQGKIHTTTWLASRYTSILLLCCDELATAQGACLVSVQTHCLIYCDFFFFSLLLLFGFSVNQIGRATNTVLGRLWWNASNCNFSPRLPGMNVSPFSPVLFFLLVLFFRSVFHLHIITIYCPC